ncbi:MAG: cytochrome c biogenesis CcdA family protein [Chloroflexota bacterium]|nr:cytochrome c biogenesis CcdA family protein [Chloroflexota bacterium]
MTLAVAFLGGLISCLSPCVLPVIPVFAAFVGGGRAAPSMNIGRARAAGFLLGFAGVFVALWVSLGLFGFALFDAIPTLRPVAGAAIIGLGLATMIGWHPMLGFGRWQGAGSMGGSFLLGAGVAIGWTPCIGPTLGAIITLAAASQTVAAGAALLLAYALGMAVPLAVIGLGLSRVRPLGRFLGAHHRAFEVASGTLIAGVGVLVATGAFGRLAGLVPWGF